MKDYDKRIPSLHPRRHPSIRDAVRLILVGALGLTFLMQGGCRKGPSAIPFHGAVTCGGKTVPTGQVLFVPLDGTPGGTSASIIKDGQYTIEAKGGVSVGRHRVQVDARRKTGRKIPGSNGREVTMIDEEVRMGPAAYAGDQSPLIVDVVAASDGHFNIEIPAK